MQSQPVEAAAGAVRYIEAHLCERLDLETVAAAVHYSKYHLHRLFVQTVGMTLHDYARRRRLTEAAKLLVFSDRPIARVARVGGYESQQAFTGIFKSMYKLTPAQYREQAEFYPLQLAFTPRKAPGRAFRPSEIAFATPSEIPAWMDLVRLTVDGFPHLIEADYLKSLRRGIEERRALILRDGAAAVGVMLFTRRSGGIDFLAVHPQYRRRGVAKLFLEMLADELPPGREISITTFRAGDKADTGHRDELGRLGFAERELLTEFGYPTQRFALPVKKKEDEPQ